ncbi:MAG: 16S rRNA (adenine(1518)-N(6)/adenine(1519)-N(6))-dimethyltransferase RsmA [Acidaminobacter sp.]|uniref:16S rRNA (adenine(1518)-N(6)/adenine(1519)-N(6))- dimethyltransferase RsmA n=1 Tax=Acidaminobacter sp. TaxID=1872102 RepID=UPI001380D2DC|nr:16S rRNA (adenine(1518)-N(6)/adenine(1519)-N(6))-dimethyltransferase RsmA [Acidaminobacter sp.]MZQ96738.1 16S rRNA (adenine(1518)-N(6)/adenine(1519)-N(6))-dimethyltransferase RsmA [Acidaminobacter sp.]
MLKLTSPSTIRYIMDKYGFRFSKSLGQNFLIDEGTVNRIVANAEVGPEDMVLEIGPGIGVMTQVLAAHAEKVVAVEIDSSLLPVLNETLEGLDNVEVVHGDILEVDVKALLTEHFGDRKPKVVANLPYYVTTPILMRFLEERLPVSEIVVMIQKEVAERMTASPSTKAYGSLSIAVQYYCEAAVVQKVPPTVFMPQPSVESLVIRLKLREKPCVELLNPDFFFKVVKAAFGQRRKTLLNALSAGLTMPKDKILEVLEAVEIAPNLRGEALTIEAFARLANAFEELK